MSRVIPADKRKRQLVLVVGPLSLPRSKVQSSSTGANTAVTLPGDASLPSCSSSEQPRSGGLREHQVLSSRAEPLSTPLPPSSTPADPHNEVERRRKLRISQNIKTLAETLTPPCHCGRTTRAEILEMVVKQIRDLQKKNSELEAQLKDLPSPATTKGEELSRRAIVLVEENLRLRVMLLAGVGSDNSPHSKPTSPEQSEGEERREEEGESRNVVGEQGEGDMDEGEVPLPSESGVTGGEQDEGLCLTIAGSSTEEHEGEHGNGATDEATGKEGSSGEIEEMEKDTGIEELPDGDGVGSESHGTSKGNTGEGGTGNQDGVDGTQVEGNDKQAAGKDTVSTESGGKESGGAADQSWPISSLLSDQTRTPLQREHGVAACGLPILSPTYIAEHCDQQFFGPATTPATLPMVASRGTSATDTGRHPTSQSTSLFTGGMAALSRVTEFSRPGLTTTPSLSTSVPVALSSSPHSHQQLSLPPPPPPRPPTRQSIVQPWVGTHNSCRSETPSTTNRRSSVGSRSLTTAAVHTPSEQNRLSVRPQHEPATASSSGFRSRASSMTWHTTTPPRPSRYSSRSSHSLHSKVSRTVSSRGHTHTPHYPDSTRLIHHNLNSVAAEIPPVGGYVSNTSLSCDGRTRPYYPGGVPYLLPSPGANFHGYTSVPLPRQPQGFTTSSIDPYYHCTHSTVYQSQQGSSFSLLPPSQCHTSQESPHSQFTPHHSHHQHTYPSLPPPPPHPLPPPPFPHHHQHPPSHQNTVWRPYSDRQQQTSLTRFSLSDILSPSPAAPLPSLGLPAAVSPPAIHHQQARISSFFVDHLLDDL